MEDIEMDNIELRDESYTKEELVGIRRYLANWLDDSKVDLEEYQRDTIPAQKVLNVLERRVKELDHIIYDD